MMENVSLRAVLVLDTSEANLDIYLLIEMLKTIAQSVLRDLAGTLPLNPESRLDADLCWNNDMHQM